MTDSSPEMFKRIKETTDLEWLMTVVTFNQAEYWYDPCGKSGHSLDTYMTDVTKAAICRAHEVLGFGRLS